jgi:Ankyrin repeats (3 copies)/Ankyrin repeat
MPSNICTALDELPTTLDETYERVLEGIPQEQQQHAHRIFQCLAVAIRPLRLEELSELFFHRDAGRNLEEGWRPDIAEDAVISACSTLIAVIEDEGSKVVHFSHFTVKDYLTSDRLHTSKMGNVRHYHIPLNVAHTILARACLTVLLQLDENVNKYRLKTFPLAFYAAQHWVEHAKYGDVASQIQADIEQLFNPNKPYLAAWTWIHNVDFGRVRETIHALKAYPTQPKATALYYAVLCGFSGVADYLITTHKENVNAECGMRGTPLHAASHKGHLEAARLLLALGADVNTINGDKKTPLCLAYDGGHLEVMRLLLKHGADMDVQYGGAGPLTHDASLHGRADVIHLLLQHNADVNIRNRFNQTPLHTAAMMGQATVVQLLLEHGAVVNAQDIAHCIPLHDASKFGHLEIVQILVRHGADVHMREEEDQTPFQVATLHGRVEVARFLLKHGAVKE